MSSNLPTQESGPPRKRRLKVSYACQSCRSRKVKCDGVRPEYGHCQKTFRLQGTCIYRFSPSDAPTRSAKAAPSLTAESPGESGGVEAHETYCINTPRAFAGKVRAAIDARLGLPNSGKLSLIPMTDAPLFGLLPRHQINDSSVYHEDNVLPSRKHANYLIEIYWRHIQPLEPLLDRERFFHSYQALFAGSLFNEDKRIFVSTLNTIFAIATQLQGYLPREKREEASKTYFNQAWTLLRPESIIWEPGSLELVQCLLLMGRYLQCTNNPHQTWMAVGSAVRIAQSLGLHLSDAASSSPAARDSRLRLHLWKCCVFMDRIISWASGRASMVSLTAIDSLHNHSPQGQSSNYFTKMLELYEIINHIMLSQTSSHNSVAGRLGLPHLYQDEEYFSTAVKLEVVINKWDKSLPRSLRLDSSQGDVGDDLFKQRVILRLRLLHARILLFRPMLARFCLSQSQVLAGSHLDQGLSDRILQSCATLCLENAQKMISLVQEYHNKPEESIGLLPWWHRVLYLHVAATTLIAATLRADLFTSSITQSWNMAMAALHSHEHFSPFVQQCVSTFQSLSSRILETHHSNSTSRGQFPPLEGGPSNIYFQDVFQDLGFDPDNILFGKDDMTWLSSFESAQ